MERWILFLGLWVLVQVPFAFYLASKRPLISRYSTWTLTRMLIPFSGGWRSEILESDMGAVERHRRVMVIYYYGLFVAPILSFFILLWLEIL